MSLAQIIFYIKVKRKLLKGQYIDVDGNIDYLFLFIYQFMEKWDNKDYERLGEFLFSLSELYIKEKKVSKCCVAWACDCLLAQEKYEEYLDKSETFQALRTSFHNPTLRLNIQRYLKLDANPIDILLMVGDRKTKFISSNHALYIDKIREVFSLYGSENGGWINIFDRFFDDKNKCTHWLFGGTPLSGDHTLKFDISSFTRGQFNIISKELSAKAENIARMELELPLIGEGWISETELFKKLKARFKETIVIQHGQPKWLGLQHYDIWFPDWKIAVEYHGKQHFEPVEFFGGVEAFKKNIERDKKKSNISLLYGVKLFIVAEGYIIEDLFKQISVHVAKKSRNEL